MSYTVLLIHMYSIFDYFFYTGNIFLLITLPLNECHVDGSENFGARLNTMYETRTSRRMKDESKMKLESTISPHQKYIMKRVTEWDDQTKTDDRVS